MFIIAHFHTQPARNNHLSVCVFDRESEGKERKSERDGGRNTKRQLGGEMKCEKETANREKEPEMKDVTERNKEKICCVHTCACAVPNHSDSITPHWVFPAPFLTIMSDNRATLALLVYSLC